MYIIYVLYHMYMPNFILPQSRKRHPALFVYADGRSGRLAASPRSDRRQSCACPTGRCVTGGPGGPLSCCWQFH